MLWTITFWMLWLYPYPTNVDFSPAPDDTEGCYCMNLSACAPGEIDVETECAF